MPLYNLVEGHASHIDSIPQACGLQEGHLPQFDSLFFQVYKVLELYKMGTFYYQLDCLGYRRQVHEYIRCI